MSDLTCLIDLGRFYTTLIDLGRFYTIQIDLRRLYTTLIDLGHFYTIQKDLGAPLQHDWQTRRNGNLNILLDILGNYWQWDVEASGSMSLCAVTSSEHWRCGRLVIKKPIVT